MLYTIPIKKDTLRKIRLYRKIALWTFAAVLIGGNIIHFAVSNRVTVKKDSYVYIEGFPFFTSEKEYIKMVKNYPYNPGVKLRIHKMLIGESFWHVTRRYNISIDTLIAANPFLRSLVAREGTEIVVPEKDGVLLVFDDIFDVLRMSRRLPGHKGVQGDYKPSFFKVVSLDDVRLVFFKQVRPVVVNGSIRVMYEFRKIFQSPVKGYYTSLYGNRLDPFRVTPKQEFHDGIDIVSRYGAPIKPAREGMVKYTGWRGGFGKAIIVQHLDGYSTLYGHCSRIKVKTGDRVTKDMVIGNVGSTGRSTGPHLHFTVWRHGKIVNPILYIW